LTGKAKVKILQQRNVENSMVIEVDIEIKGITKRRQYLVAKNLSDVEVEKHISDKVIKEEEQNVFIGKKFEVDL